MNIKSTLTIAVLALAGAGSAFADAVPYPGTGSENLTTYSFTALTTGDMVAYFDGTGAGFTETLGLLVNGVDTGIDGLQNQTTAIGTALDFGHVNAGDVLTFKLNVADTGETYYSDKSMNDDGVNHVYSASFSGDATHAIPAGTYVGFEDLPKGGDFNYTDEQFVFTNVATTVPEPASIALLLAGLGLMGGVVRRRQR